MVKIGMNYHWVDHDDLYLDMDVHDWRKFWSGAKDHNDHNMSILDQVELKAATNKTTCASEWLDLGILSSNKDGPDPPSWNPPRWCVNFLAGHDLQPLISL